MPAAPKNPKAALYTQALPLGVYLAPDADTKPTEAHEVLWLQCVSIDRGVGDRLAQAMFLVDQPTLGKRIGNEFLTENVNRQVEVWTLKIDVPPKKSEDPPRVLRDKPLFWGEIVEMELSVSAGREDRYLIAKVLPHHFGGIILGQRVWNHVLGDTEVIDMDLEFNPEIEGRIRQNAIETDDETLWVDPHSVVGTKAQENYQKPTGASSGAPVSWTLAKIIKQLCREGNESQDDIENPDGELVDNIFASAPEIKNLNIQRGDYLPGYLTPILAKYNFGWYVDFVLDDQGKCQPKIELYKRGGVAAGGLGTKTIKLQAPGSPLDPARTNARDSRLRFDVGSVVNVVRIEGAHIEREYTIPLYPGWATADDGTEDHNDVENKVGRLFVANEGGDYKDLRPDVFDEPPDLFTEDDIKTIPKRRRAMDCLTWRALKPQEGDLETHRREPFIEFKEAGSDEWKDIRHAKGDGNDFAGFSVLHDQIGFWITVKKEDDDAIPEPCLDTDTEWRMTCTVRGDQRLTFETDQDPDSPNSRLITRVIDASDRFFDRKRESEGDFASVLTGDADERNDAAAIEVEANKLLAQQKAAQVAAPFRLPGIRLEYELADIISRIDGREVSLSRMAQGTSGASYPQVAAIRWTNEPGGQFTELQVEPFDL